MEQIWAGYPQWVAVAVSVSIALAIAYLVAEIAARLTRTIFVRLFLVEGPRPFSAPLARTPIRAIRLTMFAVVALALVFPALKLSGVETQVGFEPRAVLDWFFASGLRVALIVLFAVLVVRATVTAVARFESEIARGETLDARERAKRVHTIGGLIENTVATLVVAAALLMILRELNVDILPLLTGAGILGLAVGFGAQTLVKDVISGFFMILENQVRVGDVAVINGTGGVVESMRLRTISLRDLEGTVHVFPNGSVNTLANRTKDFSFAVLDIGVAYKEDTDRVVEVLRTTGEALHQDPRFSPSILTPLEVLGVDALGDSAVVIKIRVKTLPLKQWEIGRELRRRIKKAFDAEGIEIPFPHRTLYLAPDTRLSVRSLDAPPRGPGELAAPAPGTSSAAPGSANES